MTTLPLIGLSGRRTHGHRQAGYVQELHHLDLDLYFADYARAIIEAGGLPVHLPLDVDPGLATKRLDGVLLTGGADVDPIRFDADRHPEVTTIERERDAFEFALLGEALHHELPVLGICRGMQVINVHLGGTLCQHVPEHSRYDVGSARVRTRGEDRRRHDPRLALRRVDRRQQPASPDHRPHRRRAHRDGARRRRHDRGSGVR